MTLRVLRKPLVTLNNPHHHLAGDRVFYLLGDDASLLGELQPSGRIISLRVDHATNPASDGHHLIVFNSRGRLSCR